MKIYDMLLANAMMGEGGGGGGGEFKTAQVTLKASGGSYWVYPAYTEDNNMQCIFKLSDGFNETFGTDSTPVTGTLCWIGDSGILDAYVVTDIEGDAIYDEETRQVTVTGDCTITGYMDD